MRSSNVFIFIRGESYSVWKVRMQNPLWKNFCVCVSSNIQVFSTPFNHNRTICHPTFYTLQSPTEPSTESVLKHQNTLFCQQQSLDIYYLRLPAPLEKCFLRAVLIILLVRAKALNCWWLAALKNKQKVKQQTRQRWQNRQPFKNIERTQTIRCFRFIKIFFQIMSSRKVFVTFTSG